MQWLPIKNSGCLSFQQKINSPSSACYKILMRFNFICQVGGISNGAHPGFWPVYILPKKSVLKHSQNYLILAPKHCINNRPYNNLSATSATAPATTAAAVSTTTGSSATAAASAKAGPGATTTATKAGSGTTAATAVKTGRTALRCTGL